MYASNVLPLCKGNSQCEMTVAKSLQLNIVISAGDAGLLRDLMERDRRAVNIANGNWIRSGLDTVGDLTMLTGIRGMVNPNSSYSRLVNSVFTQPSTPGMVLPRTQIGAVGDLGKISVSEINRYLPKSGAEIFYQKDRIFIRNMEKWFLKASLIREN